MCQIPCSNASQGSQVAVPVELSEVGALDPQIALLLLRHCASFCKLVHLARSTPPSFVSEGLALFDEEVRRYFTDCVAIVAMLLDIYFWCIYVCVGVQLCSPTHALVNVYKPYDCPFIAVC